MKTQTAIGVAAALIIGGGAWYWMGRDVAPPSPPPVVPPPVVDSVTDCTASQRNVDFCTSDYSPVCATVNIQCIKAPCDPVQETFSNSCNACKNPLVSSYLLGECK